MIVINWLVDHWDLVCGGAVLLVSLLNVVTRHYSGSTGVGKLALLAIDLLSFMTSGANKPYVKLPLTKSKPDIFDNYRRRVEEIRKIREQAECESKPPPS